MVWLVFVPRPILTQNRLLIVFAGGELGLVQCLHIPCSVTGMLAEVFVVRSTPLQPASQISMRIVQLVR